MVIGRGSRIKIIELDDITVEIIVFRVPELNRDTLNECSEGKTPLTLLRARGRKLRILESIQ